MQRLENNNIRGLWEKIMTFHRNENAVFYQGLFYTYEDLDVRSWKVANGINARTEDSHIGIWMDNSYDYVCAVLGVLKAGKCFVPMDVEWPKNRLEYVVKNCDLEYVITTNQDVGTMQTILMEELCNDGAHTSMEREWGTGNSAYVLHSSGTTGKPKGIEIGRKSLENLVQWFGKTFIGEDSRNVLQLTKTTFDVSIEEIFGTLFNGGVLYIPQPVVRRHKAKLRQYIEDNNIQLIEVVPATLKEFFDQDDKIPCLKTIICGADILHEELKNSIIKLGYELYNNYGPTEATVDVLYHRCSMDEPVQLGTCVDGNEIVIVGEDEEILSGCCDGELLLSGINLAIGYVNDTELNQAKFINIDGKRFYKTGDLVERDAQGRIFFKGREDNQIKIRGRRIELEEIEKVFADAMNVAFCATVCKKEHGKKIVLFYEAEKAFDYSLLTEKMKERLPDYMVPSLYQWIDQLPLTDNGKVDRKALAEYEIKSSETHAVQEYDEMTERLVEIMSEVLEMEKEAIDLNMTFEQIGFDSLSFVRYLVEVEDAWDLELDDDFLVPDDTQTAAELIKEIKKIIMGA